MIVRLCIFVGKPEGKRKYRRLECGWEDNIKMNLKEVGCKVIELTQVRVL
jgi:hypothetical protein